MKINACALYHTRIALTEPYVLSFSTVETIDVLVFKVRTDSGDEGVAEAVPLPGYTADTRESTEQALLYAMESCIGMEPEALFANFSLPMRHAPFALSALMTAAEVAQGALQLDHTLRVPLLAPVSSSVDTQSVVDKIQQALDAGFRTIKLKVGRDIRADQATIKRILDWLPDKVALRIDANQGYSLDDAIRLTEAMDHPRNSLIELFEQPFPYDDWDTFRKFSRGIANVPLMLDESIVKDEDVERSAEVGADYVKLKLFKHAGISGLLKLARKARDLGMKVVLGNGVATDIGNLIEAEVFHRSGLFSGASEGNGFAKLAWRIMTNPLSISNGDLVWSPPNGQTLSEMVDYDGLQCIKAVGFD